MENLRASELRIGNWVKSPINGYKKISPVNLCDFAHGFCTFKPIQLTEEWLLKFGFCEDKGEYGDDIICGYFIFD